MSARRDDKPQENLNNNYTHARYRMSQRGGSPPSATGAITPSTPTITPPRHLGVLLVQHVVPEEESRVPLEVALNRRRSDAKEQALVMFLASRNHMESRDQIISQSANQLINHQLVLR